MIKKVFFILAFCMFASTLGIGMVAPLFPLYVKNLGATGIWLGIMFSAYATSNAIFVPIAGRFADRRGKKWLLTIGLLAYAIISLGYIWSESLTQLAFVRFIQGIAGAMTVPIAFAYIGDLSPEEEEGKWMGYANAAFFSGFGLGPLMGGILTERFSMNVSFITMGAFNFVAFLVALFMLPEVSRHKYGDGFQPSFREMSSSGVIRGLFSFRMVQALGSAGIGTFLPIFAANMGLSTSLIGLLLTINILSVTLLTPLGGIIADRFNRRTITIVGSILAAIFLAAIVFAHNFVQLLVILLIQGISNALSTPAASALSVEEGRKYGMGSTMSMFFLAMSVGMAIGPIVSGGLADFANLNSVFYFGAVTGLVGTGLFHWFTRGYPSPSVAKPPVK